MQIFLTFDVEITGLGRYDAAKANGRHFNISLDTLDCPVGNEKYGFSWILSTLAKYGLKATFFVEPLVSLYAGPEYLAQIVSKINEYHQDIQMHLHPG